MVSVLYILYMRAMYVIYALIYCILHFLSNPVCLFISINSNAFDVALMFYLH